MSSLFGTLDLGTRSLQTQQQGLQVTGHNIANVNNPDYARQRLEIATSAPIQTSVGSLGTGADAVAIQQVRSDLLDHQIQNETSVTGYLEAQQRALQNAEAQLGQTVDTQAGSASDGSSTQNGLAGGLSDLFTAFQSLSSDPASTTQREVLLMKAADLASRFNQIDQRLGDLNSQLNQSVENDTASANDLLSQIASLNQQIVAAEANSPGSANDLRDLREQKMESLASLTKADFTTESNGAVDVAIAGTQFVSGNDVVDSLQAYDAGGGQMLVRAQAAGTPLNLTGGSIAGTIAERDGEVAGLQAGLNSLAAGLITEVNSIHQSGYNLKGGTGADFFLGSNAADIRVNDALLTDPTLLQAAGTAGASGDNQVALALAQLGNQPVASLNQDTFGSAYARTVAGLGQSLATVNSHLDDQNSVQTMLGNQRDSLSGVSLDEEMTNMMKYQQAYAASARLITTISTMLDTLLAMKP